MAKTLSVGFLSGRPDRPDGHDCSTESGRGGPYTYGGEVTDFPLEETPPSDQPWTDCSDAGLSAANARFYQALEAADLDLMIEVWSHDETVSCAHPGRPPLIGWPATAASWTAIFASGGNPQIIVTEERIVRRETIGWVTVTENMISEGHTGAAGAINLFEHDGERWMMVAHHAAPVLSIS